MPQPRTPACPPPARGGGAGSAGDGRSPKGAASRGGAASAGDGRSRKGAASRGNASARGLIPPHPSLRRLRSAAACCRACPLWERATQTVFGEGPEGARLLLVGEQPGDLEDREGRPFVGPAGRLLDRALLEAGIDRADARAGGGPAGTQAPTTL